MTSQLQFPEPVHGAINPAAGEAAKADGMERAAAATAPSWATACRAAIQTMARRGTPFQAADLIAEGLIDEPASPSQWGPAFGSAARAGVIQSVGYGPSKRSTVHRSICRIWVGTATVRSAA